MSAAHYVGLVVPALSWALFGYYVFGQAYWPSSCQPSGLIEIYVCSVRLPENPGWIQLALLTWLWATPLLVGLRLVPWFRPDASRGKGPKRSSR